MQPPARAPTAIAAPLRASSVEVRATRRRSRRAAPRVVLEAMKMEHVVAAGRRRRARGRWSPRANVAAGGRWPASSPSRRRRGRRADEAAEVDLDAHPPRPRRGAGAPRARRSTPPGPTAVARRHAAGQRTARENIADLVDAGSFVEYGALAVAAQRRRRTLEELHGAARPADGMVTGIGTDRRRGPSAPCVVLRLHGARRHAGHAQPPQDRPHARAGRAAAAAGGAVRRGRRRAARRHRHAGGRAARRARRFAHVGPAVAAWCRWSASSRAAASPATPRCSAAATSSSPPRTPTSAWAARR